MLDFIGVCADHLANSDILEVSLVPHCVGTVEEDVSKVFCSACSAHNTEQIVHDQVGVVDCPGGAVPCPEGQLSTHTLILYETR